jgi:hypothetical protein
MSRAVTTGSCGGDLACCLLIDVLLSFRARTNFTLAVNL